MLFRRLKLKRFSRATLLVLLWSALVTTPILSSTWPADGSAIDISLEEPIQSRGIVALAAGTDEISAVWANSADKPGIIIAQTSGKDWQSHDNWSTTYIETTQSDLAFFPTLAYEGKETAVTWIESTELERSDCTIKPIMHSDNGGSPQIITDNLYLTGLSSLPDLAASDVGLHLVVFGTDQDNSCTSDLYYGFRPSDESSWPTPTPIITNSTVVAPSNSGSVRYPKVAYNYATQRVHVVWEQSEIIPPPNYSIRHSVWHISGLATGEAWSAPERISPSDQQYAMLPNLAISSDGQVHIVWTQYVGNRTKPEEQYIYYKKLGASEEPVNINQTPIEANSQFPTYTSASIAVDDASVCVVWYTYAQGTAEDIFLRCTQNANINWNRETVYNVSDTADDLSIFPRIVKDAGGVTHIAWVEYDIFGQDVQPITINYIRQSHRVFMPLVLRH